MGGYEGTWEIVEPPPFGARQVAFEWHILNAGSRERDRHRAMMR